jgi:hypothetical protein
MTDLIDPTQTGNYPVVLGDGLLGKTSNDIFTGIRCRFPPLPLALVAAVPRPFPRGLPFQTQSPNPDNHTPPQTDAGTSRNARLKPSVQGSTSSYDLAANEYAFSGARNTSDDQYVLYFDPDRKVFVLDRIDSTFNMNVTRVPGNSDQESLGRKYPHLDNIGLQSSSAGASSAKAKAKAAEHAAAAPSSSSKAKPRAKSPPRKKDVALNKPKAKTEKKETKKAGAPLDMALPKKAAEKPKPKPKPRTLDEEEEDEDEDDGLLIEYPGGDPKGPKRDFSPALKSIRRFDDFMDQRESEADDADGESESEPEMVDFKLPSPANQESSRGQESRYREAEPMDEDEDEDVEHGGAGIEEDLEDDLEKDLEMAFEAADNSFNGTPADDESEISEED